MAGRLTMRRRQVLRALGCLACALATGPAWSQALSDPTRPPNAVSAGAPEAESAGARQLQSILLSGGRKLAIIDGKTVPLGGAVGEARVVKITETEVTLRTGKDVEVLKLYPTIEKLPVKRALARSAAKAPGPEGRGGEK